MGLIDSIKKIAKIAAPIVGAGIANSLLPGSTFFASALGGGIGSLLTGAKPGEALMTGLTAGAGGTVSGAGGAVGTNVVLGGINKVKTAATSEDGRIFGKRFATAGAGATEEVRVLDGKHH